MSANVSEIIPQELNQPVVKTSGDVVPTKMFGLDTRFIPPILITLILLFGQIFSGFLESYPQTVLAIVTAIVFEIVLSKMMAGKFPHLASAYISGISVGILVRSPGIYWTFALCAAISITSKYVLRIKDRHLWNPSNFGISFMLFFAPFAVASLSIQWGNNLYPMLTIWLLGSVIIYRLKRFHITITYVLSFLFFSFVRSYYTGHPFLAEVAPITGAMYQLFIFFMITDPKTTVRSSKAAQIFVAFMVAFVEMLLRLTENVHAPYYALFIVGPIANLIDIWWLSRKASLEAATAN
jgi:Na+-translocating ferredoxin:NAD+ oxidoreductase RnfD subunit